MTIGILTAADVRLAVTEHRLKHMFLTSEDNCYSLNPNKSRQAVDVLLLLDTGGLNCNVSYTLSGCKVPPYYPGQDQWYEYFRVHNMDWHLRRGTPIIAFGSSALMLWGALGGKVEYNDEQLVVAKDHNLAEFGKFESLGLTNFPASDCDFSCGVYVGLESQPMDIDLYRIASKLVRRKLDMDTANIAISLNPKVPVLVAAAQEAIVHEELASLEIPTI